MQKYLKKEIKTIFNEYESFVISIKGDWGSGKTYFWNQFKDKHLDDVKYAYISLFGKESIEDIKRDVIFQISTKDKHLTTIKEKVSNIKTTFGFKEEDTSFGVTGAAIGLLMSLFEKKDFENVVVCLDDFERRSKNLDIKEVLGYLSILKETYKCKIVLILNEEKISDEEKVYKDYKEKIIDFEYTFMPTVKECFNVVKNDLKNYHYIFIGYCKFIGLNNIRVMKRVVRLLNKIHDALENKEYRDSTIEKFINEVLFLSIVHYKFGFIEFENLEQYMSSKRMIDYDKNLKHEFSLNEEYENIINVMNVPSFFYIDIVDKEIIEYLTSSILDINVIKKELDKLDKNYDDQKIKDDLFSLEDDFLYDLGSVPKEYVDKVYLFLDKHRSNIFRLTTFDNYIFYFKQLGELDPENNPKYESLLEETAQEFVTYLMGLEEDEYLKYKDRRSDIHIFEKFKENIPNIGDYIDEIISKKKVALYDCEKLLQVIKDIDQKSGWSLRDAEFLNSASKDFYEQCLLKPEILEEIMIFLRHNGKTPNFAKAKDTIFEVFNDIETKNINGNAYKIKRIKYLSGYQSDEVESSRE